MTDDKYIKKKVNPIIEDIKAVWKLDDSDEWLKDFKETIEGTIDKAYEDGFQDGIDEGREESEPDEPLRDESRD